MPRDLRDIKTNNELETADSRLIVCGSLGAAAVCSDFVSARRAFWQNFRGSRFHCVCVCGNWRAPSLSARCACDFRNNVKQSSLGDGICLIIADANLISCEIFLLAYHVEFRVALAVSK